MQNRNRINSDLRFVFTISHMKVRRLVIIVKHGNNNAKKAGNFRHRSYLF